MIIAIGLAVALLGWALTGEAHEKMDDAVAQRQAGASIPEAGPQMADGCALEILAILLFLTGVLVAIAAINGLL
jgi:hypothetical protein